MVCQHCRHDWHGQPCKHATIKTALGGKRLVYCPCPTSFEESK